jgi:hypothetical protein
VTPAQCRREAYRILRDARASMSRSVHEAERLLRLAEGHDPAELRLRRRIEDLELLEPEFFVEGALQ